MRYNLHAVDFSEKVGLKVRFKRAVSPPKSYRLPKRIWQRASGSSHISPPRATIGVNLCMHAYLASILLLCFEEHRLYVYQSSTGADPGFCNGMGGGGALATGGVLDAVADPRGALGVGTPV